MERRSYTKGGLWRSAKGVLKTMASNDLYMRKFSLQKARRKKKKKKHSKETVNNLRLTQSLEEFTVLPARVERP